MITDSNRFKPQMNPTSLFEPFRQAQRPRASRAGYEGQARIYANHFLTTYEHLCALIFRGYKLAAEKLRWPSLRPENAAAAYSRLFAVKKSGSIHQCASVAVPSVALAKDG
jgi:hypothetical protein